MPLSGLCSMFLDDDSTSLFLRFLWESRLAQIQVHEEEFFSQLSLC